MSEVCVMFIEDSVGLCWLVGYLVVLFVLLF